MVDFLLLLKTVHFTRMKFFYNSMFDIFNSLGDKGIFNAFVVELDDGFEKSLGLTV